MHYKDKENAEKMNLTSKKWYYIINWISYQSIIWWYRIHMEDEFKYNHPAEVRLIVSFNQYQTCNLKKVGRKHKHTRKDTYTLE